MTRGGISRPTATPARNLSVSFTAFIVLKQVSPSISTRTSASDDYCRPRRKGPRHTTCHTDGEYIIGACIVLTRRRAR